MRSALLAVVGVDVALVVAGVIGYPAFWNQRGSLGDLVEPVAMLAVYAVVILAVTRSAPVERRRMPRVAILVGAGLGVLEAVNISVETSIDRVFTMRDVVTSTRTRCPGRGLCRTLTATHK